MNLKEATRQQAQSLVDFIQTDLFDVLSPEEQEACKEQCEAMWEVYEILSGLNRVESIMGFVAWLADRGEPTLIADHMDAISLTPLIRQFAEANGLSGPTDDFPQNLKRPSDP